MLCASCQKELKEGQDVIGVQEGIIGPRGFVQLEERLLLCSIDCMKSYFADNGSYVERIP